MARSCQAALLLLVGLVALTGCGQTTTTTSPVATSEPTTVSVPATTELAITTSTTGAPPTSHATTTTEPDSALAIAIVDVTSPVSPGQTATLRATTTPGAECSIAVNYSSGASEAKGLEAATADDQGEVSWSWKVGPKTATGDYSIDVSATLDGASASAATSFKVE